tara:strand:- start:1003 stop:2175 length:1173 start_codon:yes stop_codon:yes gene_type:complete
MNKILIVTLNWKNSGGVHKRAELLKEKFSKNYNIEHIFINDYIKFNLFRVDKLRINIINFLNYRNKLKEYKIVIAFSNLPSIFSLFSKCYLITVITGSTYHYKESSFISKLYWVSILEPLIYFSARKIIPAAPHLIPFYVKKTNLHKKVKYINGLIDLESLKKNTFINRYRSDQFSKINLRNCICLSSALIGHKGIIEFLEIFLKYKKILKNNYLKLIIIGDGPLLSECFEFCRRNGLIFQFKSKVFSTKNDLFFTGHLEDPLQIIYKCRLFVMPSFHEGLSNQLLEAIYSGIPIIASNCPGNRFVHTEILKENEDYIKSNFLKLLPTIRNIKIKKTWTKELIFYTKYFKKFRYQNSNILINKFSSLENFPEWENIVKNILYVERDKIIN